MLPSSDASWPSIHRVEPTHVPLAPATLSSRGDPADADHGSPERGAGATGPPPDEDGTDASDRPVAGNTPPFFEGLVGRFTELMGERASYSTFHFAAHQEGLRIGSDFRPSALKEMLRHMDGILGQKSTLEEHSNQQVLIRVRDSGLLGRGDAIMQGIALGFMEGGLQGCLGRRMDGTAAQDDDGVVIRFASPTDGGSA